MTFEQYAMARLPGLLGTARAICGDGSLAEDLVQDVLIKVHQRWDMIEGLDAPDAYVRRMLVNQFISWRRKWGRLIPHADLPAGRLAPDVADHATAHADRDVLLGEIRQLPPRQRVVIALRYYADLSDAEIAATLGCAESTVRVHAHRALTALRVQIQPTLTRKDG